MSLNVEQWCFVFARVFGRRWQHGSVDIKQRFEKTVWMAIDQYFRCTPRKQAGFTSVAVVSGVDGHLQ